MFTPIPKTRRVLPQALVLGLATSIATLVPAGAEASTRVLAALPGVSIMQDTEADAWTIGGDRIALTLGLGVHQELLLRRLTNPETGRVLISPSAPDTALNLNGQSFALAEGATGLHYDGAVAETWHGGVRLAFTYSHQALKARVVRHYACYPGSPTIETWTTVQMSAGAILWSFPSGSAGDSPFRSEQCGGSTGCAATHLTRRSTMRSAWPTRTSHPANR